MSHNEDRSQSKTVARTAGRILRYVARFSWPVPADLAETVQAILDDRQSLDAAWQRLQKARRHGWELAAGQILPDLVHEAGQLQARLERLLSYRNPSRPDPPTLRSLVADLQQLQQEFEEVEIPPGKSLVIARTEAIELEDVYLGRFAIELHLERLAGSVDVRCFDCVALDPNPATSNDAVTHPHVQDKSLCPGDASVPIAQALKQGRIADAFCLVRSVLRTYNPSSPYVALDSWNGEYCHDCERTVDPDDIGTCEHCENQFCSGCTETCDLCEQSCCRGCIEFDSVSRKSCCPDCRHICDGCDRIVDIDSYNTESEFCPECEQKRRETNKENDHESPEDQPQEAQPEPALAG
jgi:hypothetical protein